MNIRYLTLIVLWISLCVLAQSPAAAQLQANVLSMDWSADGSRFAITTRLGLSIYDPSLNQIAYQSFPTNIEFVVPSIALNPDGTRIFVGNGIENRILDTTTLAPIVDFQNASILFYTPQWNSDGSEIAFRRDDDRGTEIYDATTGDLLRSFSSQLWRVGFFNLKGMPIWSPDNAYFAGVINADTVVVFDANSGQELAQYQIGSEKIDDIVWSPDQTNPRLALASRAEVELGSPDSFPDPTDSTRAIRYSLTVVEAISGTVLSSTTGLRDWISLLAWSPNGMELAGADMFRKLYVWDANTGDLIDSYLTAPYEVRTLEYSPYGGRLLLAHNIRFESQQRADDEFIPLSTFAQSEFDDDVQFVAPASSPEKTQSILSLCATDPDIAATGNSFIASGQYGEFIQWLGQQDESLIPPLCADDLHLMAEAISMTAPEANAGPDQSVTASSDGTALVTLDGSGSSDSDGTIVAYRWYENDTLIAEGMAPQIELGVGVHTIILTVVDDDGAIGSDDVTIVVEPPSYPFFEDFESGTNKWTLTGYWDSKSTSYHSSTWSVRTARGQDYTAYTDTLTLNDPIDIPVGSTPYFTYWSRYKLSINERVQVQVSTDDGASWTTVETYSEITNLNWNARRIDLRGYQGQSIRLRFVFVATACTSDCVAGTSWWIDDVRVDEFPPDALNEGFETGTSQWTLTDRWASSSDQHHSGSWSVQSARGDCTAFTERLTLNDPLNLTDFSAPLLTYWSQYRLSSLDSIRVQVYVVGSGGSWTTIQTISNLTNNTSWMRQRIDLSPYIGQSIRLRFTFTATAASGNCVNARWWIDDISVTEQPAMTFADDFELGLADWTVSTRWDQSDIQHHSGSWAEVHNRGTDHTAYAELLSLNVPLDLTTSDIPVLTFWTRYWLSSYEIVRVQVRPVGNPGWTTLWTKTDETNNYWSELIWWRQQLDLSPYRGQSLDLRFRFQANACTSGCVEGRRWWIDDVQIAELPPPRGDLPFVDDIEGATSNWTMTGGWSFATDSTDPNNIYLDGTIRTSTYQNPETLQLTEPLDLVGIRQPKLRFRTKYWFLGYPAYGAIQVSVDSGAHWETLQEIENANATTWQNPELDLSVYAGRSIQLRFRLYSTIPSASNAIWEIDDVIVQETAP
jgi:hypothetical protein